MEILDVLKKSSLSALIAKESLKENITELREGKTVEKQEMGQTRVFGELSNRVA